MKIKIKKLRVTVSFCLFIIFILFFLRTDHLSLTTGNIINFFQFTPSFLKFIFNGFNLLATGFIFVLILTFIGGRIYCSFFCPLGIFQDFLIYIIHWFRPKTRYHFLSPYNLLRIIVILSVIITLSVGSLVIINLLDPLSIFSRFMSILVKPVLAVISNSIISGLNRFGIYPNFNLSLPVIPAFVWITTLLFFLGLIGIVVLRGRLFCNTLCPVGIVLGFVSRYSLFNIRLNSGRCISCRRCENLCKAGCIDADHKQIDLTRCVSCYNCLGVCPEGAIHYHTAFNNRKIQPDFSRRTFLKALGVIVCGIFPLAGYSIRPSVKRMLLSLSANLPAIPPGAVSLSHFTNNCTACYQCVSICPTHVLRPGNNEYGMTGILQPRMDFAAAYCDYECKQCTDICPTGAIRPLLLTQKKQVQIGVSQLIKNLCIVYNKHQDCGACSEHCPTKAVYMIPWNNIYGPETRTDICIGCGACEYVCPVRPVRAITVIPHPEHQTALFPENLPPVPSLDHPDQQDTADFPF